MVPPDMTHQTINVTLHFRNIIRKMIQCLIKL
uniref:Uncharacterized protein n=1 Tax=Rhizophora mucronata TaxID=61149 RepID=A0A2P2PII4_RHIMU